jgi:hypothetical protein
MWITTAMTSGNWTTSSTTSGNQKKLFLAFAFGACFLSKASKWKKACCRSTDVGRTSHTSYLSFCSHT